MLSARTPGPKSDWHRDSSILLASATSGRLSAIIEASARSIAPPKSATMYLRLAKRLLWKPTSACSGSWPGISASRAFARCSGTKRGSSGASSSRRFSTSRVINSCNLRCQGCWVDVAAKQARIEPAAMHRLIGEAKAMGNSFFGILGGEPFMHPEILEILGGHRDCYFQVFTNGHFITDEVAQEAARVRQRHAAGQRRGERDRQRRAPRPRGRAQPDDAGPAELPEAQGDDRRLHEPLPDQLRPARAKSGSTG